MSAEVELQRVMIPHQRSWLEHRAVCWDHGHDNGVPNWAAPETHPEWIFARLDAVEHNLSEHPHSPSWDEIVYGTNPTMRGAS